ncbi:hypothetical protein MK280_20225, partial [Myxococcota bacterium]|nr:hypothetical protein [Myxococcota bacterium]
MEEVVRVLRVDPKDCIRSILQDPALRDFSWSDCESIEQAPSVGEQHRLDVCVTVLDPADASGLSLAASRLMHDPSGMGWLVVVPAEASGDPERALEAGADECLLAPIDAVTLRRSILRLLNLRRLAARNRFLLETIRIMEDCRALAHCLEASQLYPLALELLLRATGRRRGFTLFLRDTPGQGRSAAVRGFSEVETARICRSLTDDQH